MKSETQAALNQAEQELNLIRVALAATLANETTYRPVYFTGLLKQHSTDLLAKFDELERLCAQCDIENSAELVADPEPVAEVRDPEEGTKPVAYSSEVTELLDSTHPADETPERTNYRDDENNQQG